MANSGPALSAHNITVLGDTMGVAVAQPAKVVARIPGRRYDHVFFSVTVALMWVAVIVGFGPTYYFAGLWNAPLSSPIVHIHAVLFSCWMLLLVTQISLVTTNRVHVHRRLGIAGCVLAAAMVVFGVLAATDSLIRPSPVPGRDVLAFYIFPMSNMFMFAVLMVFAYLDRRDSPSHKRLILIATTALMLAAVTRWHVEFIHRQPLRAGLASDIFLLMLVAYDLWSLRKIHRTTLYAGAFLLFVQHIRFFIGGTATWHQFAAWMQALAT
jgi:FtsH-binding integral membrane protein